MTPEKIQTNIIPMNPVSDLVVAATNLAIACEEIDNAIDVTAEVKAHFTEALLRTAVGVDQVLNARLFLKAKVEEEKEWRRQSKAREAAYSRVLEEINTQAVALVDAFPNQPFKGSALQLGTQKNPPAVETTLQVKEKSLTNVIEIEDIQKLGISEKYYRTHMLFCLDLKAIGDDLKAGVEITWAKLTQGKRLNTKKG